MTQTLPGEVRHEVRPREVHVWADRAWQKELREALDTGLKYPEAVKLAQKAYDKVIRRYDRQHRK